MLLSDPVVAMVPVLDNGEPLVDLGDIPTLRVDPPQARRRRRLGTRKRCRRPNAWLALKPALPDGLRLLVIECYRLPALKQHYFCEYRASLAALHPGADDATLDVLASRHVSPVAVAPGCTGGARSMSRCVPTMEPSSIAAPPSTPTPRTAKAAAARPHRWSSARRVPSATRWSRRWSVSDSSTTHQSGGTSPLGERYWAAVTGATHVCYGPLDRPTS